MCMGANKLGSLKSLVSQKLVILATPVNGVEVAANRSCVQYHHHHPPALLTFILFRFSFILLLKLS